MGNMTCVFVFVLALRLSGVSCLGLHIITSCLPSYYPIIISLLTTCLLASTNYPANVHEHQVTTCSSLNWDPKPRDRQERWSNPTRGTGGIKYYKTASLSPLRRVCTCQFRYWDNVIRLYCKITMVCIKAVDGNERGCSNPGAEDSNAIRYQPLRMIESSTVLWFEHKGLMFSLTSGAWSDRKVPRWQNIKTPQPLSIFS